MTLQQLYYFRAIAKHKNYTKASQELLVAQSTLSHSIADLENELSVPLFYKKGRHIDITNYGVRFLQYVERILSELEAAKQDMKLLVDPNFGKVRLTFGHTLCNYFIPNIINKFYENPENRTVQFEFSENQANKILEDLFKNKKTDLGFGAKIEDDSIECYPIIQEEMVAIVSKMHPLASRENINLKDLESENIVTYSYSCGTRYYIDNIFKEVNIAPKITQEVENEKVMASVVASDLGVGIMPLIPELAVYNVVPIQLNNSTLKRTLYMSWQKNEFILPVVKNFRNFVIETVKLERGRDLGIVP